MQIKICIDNIINKFNAFKDAIQFLQTANANEASSRLIKLLDNVTIKEWVKAHDNCLPLGSLVIDNVDGDIEIFSLIGIFNYFHKSSYNISNDDLDKLEELISSEVNTIIEDVFTILYEYEIIAPSIHCVVAKFNADFSSFELEEDLIKKDC